MKKIQITLFIFLWASMFVKAQNLSFDAKYVKVGVLSNGWPSQLLENPNLRNLGSISIPLDNNKKVEPKLVEKMLNDQNAGKKVLDILLQRDSRGLHMDKLYEQSLQNTTIEEIEVAFHDKSAEMKDVLKKEISRQLLKCNYIIIFQTIKKKNIFDKEVMKIYWQIFQVGIDDNIIEQAFLNWRSAGKFDQIKVPVTFVAKGKIGNQNELIFDIAKKVPAFAIRGSIFSRTPILARTTSQQGVKKRDRFYIYRFKENKSGKIYSKKVSTARSTQVNNSETRLFTISGRYASAKKGDIAVQKDRHKSSFTIMGQYSAGNDPRYGGRLQYEHLLSFSKKGVAQYFLTGIEYSRYKPEPNGVWWSGTETVRPVLQHTSLLLGYGLGINFLGRFEMLPYVLIGCQSSFMGSLNEGEVWNHDKKTWEGGFKGIYSSAIGYAGARFNMNIWYPVQLTFGADYNIYLYPYKEFEPAVRQHELNRLNIYAGLRIHF